MASERERSAYLQLVVDEESFLSGSDDNNARVTSIPSRGKRLVYRVGMILAAVALVGAGVKVFQQRTGGAQSQSGELDAIQEKASPCAIQPMGALCPANGQYFGPAKSCCLKTCGAKCGSTDCQKAAAGFQNCCTGTFTKLCGSAGAVAPCKIPTTLSGALQLLVSNLAALTGNTAGTEAAAQAALAQLFNVPVADVSAKMKQLSSGGRRLTAAVNVEYQIRFAPAKALAPAAIHEGGYSSAALSPILAAKLTEQNINVALESVVLPTPVSTEAGTVAVGATTPVPLLSFTTTTPSPTHTIMGLLYIKLAAEPHKSAVLTSQRAREALVAGLATVFGVATSAVRVTGMGDAGEPMLVKAGYVATIPVSVTTAMAAGKDGALLVALKQEYLNSGVDAEVTQVTIEPPVVSTTPAPTPAPPPTTTPVATTAPATTTTPAPSMQEPEPETQ